MLTPSHTELDITDKNAVMFYLEQNQPDIVIHCAAVSDVGACEREPERSRRINVAGSENIAGAAGKIGAKCLMCSSDQVYVGSRIKTPHSEEEELFPGNEYGKQKLAMEQCCLRVNPDAVMLRLSWMYDVKRRQEQEHDSFMRKLIEDMKKKADLSFPVHDKRGITNVREVVENLEKAFCLPGGVYNFGAYNDRNTYEMMRDVFGRIRGYEEALLHKNTSAFADNPRNICMKVEKIENAGIRFSSTEEGIVEALKAFFN